MVQLDPMPAEVLPLQIVCGVTIALGSGLTVTTTVFDLVHPVAVIVSVSVYVVVAVRVAVGLQAVVELKPVAGLHEYV